MSFKKIFALFISALFIFSLHTSCSSGKERETKRYELYKKVIKEREEIAKSRQYREDDEAKREKQIAVADACFERYNSCLEKCVDNSCENKCSDALSSCEKDLPLDLKIIKK